MARTVISFHSFYMRASDTSILFYAIEVRYELDLHKNINMRHSERAHDLIY